MPNRTGGRRDGRVKSVVRIVIPSLMRERTGGADVVQVEARTLKEAIARLDERYPGIKALLLDEEGHPHAHVAFFIDGVEAEEIGGLLAPTPPGAEIVIVPALSGGAGGEQPSAPLEDEFGDIVRKAREGKGLSPEEAARASGISPGRLRALESYEGPPTRAESDALSRVLELEPEALWRIATGEYRPSVQGEQPDLEIHTFTFQPVGSHGYLLHYRPSGDTLLVDPGGDPEAILAALDARGWRMTAVLITHGHSDHVAGLEGVLHSVDVPVYAHPGECPHPKLVPVTESGDLVIGMTPVQVIHAPGHTANGLAFYVGGACAVGDTLFAGSLGRALRGPAYYGQLLTSARRILELPPETWLLPGHGPATTVDQERRANPFLAGTPFA